MIKTLIVDDDTSMRLFLVRCLKKNNITDLVQAEEGGLALKKFINGWKVTTV